MENKLIDFSGVLQHFNPKTSLFWSDIYGYCRLSEICDRVVYFWQDGIAEDEHTDNNLCVLGTNGTFDDNECHLWWVDEDGYRHQNWKELDDIIHYLKGIKPNDFVAIGDELIGLRVGIYLGNGKAKLVVNPNTNTNWKYIIPISKIETNDSVIYKKYNLTNFVW